MDERTAVPDAVTEPSDPGAADVARRTGLEEATVGAVLADLREAGVLRGYRAVVDWDRAGADRVRARVEANVELDRETGYDDVARRIAASPAVASLHLVSGDYDFAVGVEADSMGAVSTFVAERLAPMPEVTRTVTHYVMETYKEGGVRFDDPPDDRRAVSP